MMVQHNAWLYPDVYVLNDFCATKQKMTANAVKNPGREPNLRKQQGFVFIAPDPPLPPSHLLSA